VLDDRPAFELRARELLAKLEPAASPQRTSHERIAVWMEDWLMSPRHERVAGPSAAAGA
jgi:hypothetical protein